MDVRHLRYFAAIAEEGSLSGAAARIGIAQPSLSQHVKTLETRLGVALVSRSPRGVTLTEAGEVLLVHARQILAAVDAAGEAVRLAGSQPRGQVTVGLPSSVSMVLSVPLAETLRVEAPQIRFRAREAMSGHIREWLEEGSIDFGFLYGLDALRHMQARQILVEDLHVFTAADSWPFATPPGVPVPLADIALHELVLPSTSHGLRALIERYARAAGVRLNVWLEMDALTQIKELVARGSAATILAPASARDRAERGEMVGSPIARPALRRPVYIVKNPARRQTRATFEVERITLAVIEELVLRGLWPAEWNRAPAPP